MQQIEAFFSTCLGERPFRSNATKNGLQTHTQPASAWLTHLPEKWIFLVSDYSGIARFFRSMIGTPKWKRNGGRVWKRYFCCGTCWNWMG
jgi:hypothetical protein